MPRVMPEVDMTIREAAFEWLDRLRSTGISHRPRPTFRTEFSVDGEVLPLMDRQKGIWNPQKLLATLSVTSTLRAKRQGLYEDVIEQGTGAIRYSFQGGAGLTNAALRRAAELKLPIIHFEELPGRLYTPSYPVYVNLVEEADFVMLDFDRARSLRDGTSSDLNAGRSYIEQTIWRRLHQPAFRGLVLDAYASKCAICTFSHAEMLDAAHILGDRHPLGEPIAPNGMALCKIHHAAYDRNIIGVTPNYEVRVARRILAERNGPMLKHGIQEMHERTLHLPKRRDLRPAESGLAERWAEFEAADAA